MNVAASVLMVSGAALTLVAAIGVLRFPDVLARLHAATKAASIGIALVLVGAGAALGAGPLAFLSLVAVFQVLTAPVAAHTLGRAVRHDPDPDPPHVLATLSLAPRVIVLALIWLALWGEITVANVAGGLIVGAAVATLTRRPGSEPLRVKPLATLRFGGVFLVLMVRSTIAVAAAALGPRHLVAPAVLRVDVPPCSVPALVATANAVSLTPGTLTLAVDPDGASLDVHLIRPDDPAVAAIGRLHALASAALPTPLRQGESDLPDRTS